MCNVVYDDVDRYKLIFPKKCNKSDAHHARHGDAIRELGGKMVGRESRRGEGVVVATCVAEMATAAAAFISERGV